jgi:YggT family protein
MPMFSILDIAGHVISALMMLIVISSILSWFTPDPRNPIVRLVNSVVEPLLHPIRAILPNMGPLDLSPMAAIAILYLLQRLLTPAP